MIWHRNSLPPGVDRSWVRSAMRRLSLKTYLREFSPDPEPERTKNDTSEAPTDRHQLGAHAKQLLDDPVLALAFDKLTEDLAAAWRDSKLGEGEKRDDAYRMVKAIEAVKSRLQALADNAKVLQAEQERREKEDERKRAA